MATSDEGDSVTNCQRCGRRAETRYVEFHQNIGALILRFHKSQKGHLCRECINDVFWPFTGITLFSGWLGVISLILTPFILINNVVYYVGSIGMAAPPPGALRHGLDRSSMSAIRPYMQEITDRLGAEEPAENVVRSIALKAGVRRIQVAEFMLLMAELADQDQ